jgi:hypothetical protein
LAYYFSSILLKLDFHDYFAIFPNPPSNLNHYTTITRECASAANMSYDDRGTAMNQYEHPAAQANPYANGLPPGLQSGPYGVQNSAPQGFPISQNMAAPRQARGGNQVVKLVSKKSTLDVLGSSYGYEAGANKLFWQERSSVLSNFCEGFK